jgi:hypothetical protein
VPTPLHRVSFEVAAREIPAYSIYGVSPTLLSLEGSRGFSASCSSTLLTLPASGIDIVLVPHAWADNGAFNALSSMASIAGCSREYVPATAKLSTVSGKAIEGRPVKFGCVEGEVEEGRRSGGGYGAHLRAVVQTRSPEKQAVNAHPFSRAPRLQPTFLLPSLNIRRTTSQQPNSPSSKHIPKTLPRVGGDSVHKWDSYP